MFSIIYAVRAVPGTDLEIRLAAVSLPLFLGAFVSNLFNASLNFLCSLCNRVAELYEYAMLPEHMRSPDPTVGGNSITETGALCISSGSKAGRVPK